jgi:DNA helicase-2/ATP-dependent DNA helicase PcrA
MRTTILFGPPGTGKTTTLLKMVDAALKRGIPPDRIAFFAFTRKAAHEARARAIEQFDLKDDDLPWFRTLHSAAFKILGLSSSEVMQDSSYAEIGAALGRFTFAHSYSEDTERVPLGGALGDLALSIYSRARSRCVDIETEWLATDDMVSLADAKRFAVTLDDYKREFQLLDFSDFLDEVHSQMGFDLLIIDEAQDLTRQQWNFVRRIGADAKAVVIAGDDDQAIFQWAGADLTTFLGMRGDVRVLPVSHRLPFLIWQKSQDIASRIRYRQPKEWSARPDDIGSLRKIDDLSQVDLLSGGSWLMLTRLRWQLSLMVERCVQQGVIYQHEGLWSNQTPEVRAVVAFERLRRGEAIPGQRAMSALRYVPGVSVPKQQEIMWEDVSWPFEGRPDWMHAFTAMGVEAHQYIRRLRANDQSLVNPGNVVLSTIHGVKGGEADNVVMLPDTSKRIEKSMLTDPDAEARVWYVGASRARHQLNILAPSRSRHYAV